MIVNTDFGGFSLYFNDTATFIFECDETETRMTRRELETLRMMVDAALNTSAEELDAS